MRKRSNSIYANTEEDYILQFTSNSIIKKLKNQNKSQKIKKIDENQSKSNEKIGKTEFFDLSLTDDSLSYKLNSQVVTSLKEQYLLDNEDFLSINNKLYKTTIKEPTEEESANEIYSFLESINKKECSDRFIVHYIRKIIEESTNQVLIHQLEKYLILHKTVKSPSRSMSFNSLLSFTSSHEMKKKILNNNNFQSETDNPCNDMLEIEIGNMKNLKLKEGFSPKLYLNTSFNKEISQIDSNQLSQQTEEHQIDELNRIIKKNTKSDMTIKYLLIVNEEYASLKNEFLEEYLKNPNSKQENKKKSFEIIKFTLLNQNNTSIDYIFNCSSTEILSKSVLFAYLNISSLIIFIFGDDEELNLKLYLTVKGNDLLNQESLKKRIVFLVFSKESLVKRSFRLYEDIKNDSFQVLFFKKGKMRKVVDLFCSQIDFSRRINYDDMSNDEYSLRKMSYF